MTRFRVVIQPAAEVDIEEAYRWIADQSPENAERWYLEVRAAVESLSHMPRRCRAAPESPAFGYETRQLVVGNYRVLFTILDDAVVVLHFRHAARKRMRKREISPPEFDE